MQLFPGMLGWRWSFGVPLVRFVAFCVGAVAPTVSHAGPLPLPAEDYSNIAAPSARLAIPSMPHTAARQPLIAFSWSNTAATNSFIKPMFIPRNDLTSSQVAEDAFQFLSSRAPGQRGMLLYTDEMIGSLIRSYPGNACRSTNGLLLAPSMQCPWLDAGAALLKKRMDIFFRNLRGRGVELDRIALNVEAYQLDSWGNASTGGMNGDPARYLAVLNDPRFYRDNLNFPAGHPLRQSVASALGFDDLSLVLSSHQLGWIGPSYYAIWNSLMSARIAAYLNEAVATPARRYYPAIKISDNPRQLLGADFLPDENGVPTRDCSNSALYCGHGDYVGTHQDPTVGYSPRLGAGFTGGAVKFDGIRIYGNDLFSALKYSVNKVAIGIAADRSVPLTPTVACRSFAHHQATEQAMYPEHILHALLSGVDDINFWNPNGSTFTGINGVCVLPETDDQILNGILAEFNSILGYSDRRTLRSAPIDWYSDYVLSGMEAGGRRYYRFTPGQHPGIPGTQAPLTLAGTIVSTSPLTLVTPQARIVFHGGQIWSPAQAVSDLGIWIQQSLSDPLPVISSDGINSPPVIDFRVLQDRTSGTVILTSANSFDEDGYIDRVEWDAPWDGTIDFAYSHEHPLFHGIQLPADYFAGAGIHHVALAAYDNLGSRSCVRASFYMPASPCAGYSSGSSCELSFGIGSSEAC